MKIFVPKPPGYTKSSHFSEMQDNALMHREGLKGLKYIIIQTKTWYGV